MAADNAAAAYAAMRELFEGGAPLALIATAARLSERHLAQRARREGWAAPVRRKRSATSLSDRERLERTRSKLIREMHTLARSKAKTGEERERINQLSQAARTLGKVADTFAPPAEGHEEEDPVKRDAELAAVLQRLHDHMLELAEERAAELVERRLVELAGDPHPARAAAFGA
jgi:hypothetical protein